MMQTDSSKKTEEALPSTLPQLIYILGNSHSGSTLLGFLLTANPDIIFLGELKSQPWLKDYPCSCGKRIPECPFYCGIYDTMNKLKETAMQTIRKKSPFYFIWNKKNKLDSATRTHLSQLRELIEKQISTLYPNASHWVDSSKSIWLLDAWLQVYSPEQIKILWIKRKTAANVASFVKRGKSFFRSLMSVTAHTWLIHRYLKRNKLDYLVVNYDHFYDSFESESKLISKFLLQNISATYSDLQNHHVNSGNGKTRLTFTGQFKGFQEDTEWKQLLTGTQKKVISWVK